MVGSLMSIGKKKQQKKDNFFMHKNSRHTVPRNHTLDYTTELGKRDNRCDNLTACLTKKIVACHTYR